MVMRLLWLSVWLILSSFAAVAQTKPQPSPDPPRKVRDEHWQNSPDSGLPDEMRKRMEVERAETDHRKILEDVDKLNELSSEVARGYHERGKLSNEDLKRVTTIEKLAKHVLNHTLGDEVEDKSQKPLTMAEAVDQMKTAAGNIKQTMKAETRFEVSAVVIANSNEVINLVHFIKRSHNKTD
ncbi:MAG TPA: hypothetical protein VNS63_08950 [Blastocatellia bacterium]|nr:hypothetical protein [Blastocatellia bacterium]